MINNQLPENNVIQLLNLARLGRDNAERADNHADHSYYLALVLVLEELLERRSIEIKLVASVNDHYSKDGVNDEISTFLPVGTRLYTVTPPSVSNMTHHTGRLLSTGNLQKLITYKVLYGDLEPCPGESSIYPMGRHTHGCRAFYCVDGHYHIAAEPMPEMANNSHSHDLNGG